MSHAPKKVGLVILTGDEDSRKSLKRWLKLESSCLGYRMKVLEIGNPEATILIFKSKLGENVPLDRTFEDLHWLCGEGTLGDSKRYQSPYKKSMPRGIFIGMLVKLWTPVNQAELDIAIQILNLHKEISAM